MIAKQRVVLFKPKKDDRYDASQIISHEWKKIESIAISKTSDIVDNLKDKVYDVVGIDEVQFFDQHIVNLCNRLADQGTRVILAWLDLDYMGRPFGPMPQLLAVADEVEKLNAICTKCGADAHYSFRMCPSDKQVFVAGSDCYMALCRRCYNEVSE